MRLSCIVNLFFLSTTISRSAEEAEIPLPVPPTKQTAAWIPPESKLPKTVVDAVSELFKDGLPDPRGCEYRQLRLGADVEHSAGNPFP